MDSFRRELGGQRTFRGVINYPRAATTWNEGDRSKCGGCQLPQVIDVLMGSPGGREEGLAVCRMPSIPILLLAQKLRSALYALRGNHPPKRRGNGVRVLPRLRSGFSDYTTDSWSFHVFRIRAQISSAFLRPAVSGPTYIPRRNL